MIVDLCLYIGPPLPRHQWRLHQLMGLMAVGFVEMIASCASLRHESQVIRSQTLMKYSYPSLKIYTEVQRQQYSVDVYLWSSVLCFVQRFQYLICVYMLPDLIDLHVWLICWYKTYHWSSFVTIFGLKSIFTKHSKRVWKIKFAWTDRLTARQKDSNKDYGPLWFHW